MDQTYTLEEQYELFEGDIRKLDELVGQLELWSDEYTINHKKEEIRLPQYVELHLNLEELQEQLNAFVAEYSKEAQLSKKLIKDQEAINTRLEEYKETEEVIHNWIREIEDVYGIIAKSEILQQNQAFIEAILEG